MPELRRYAPWVKSPTMLTLLGAWAVYSFAIQMFVRPLNKITVPVLEMPLGMYLAVQGAFIVFAILLFWFARREAKTA
jgi:putative solute:sodium symporter small subunit